MKLEQRAVKAEVIGKRERKSRFLRMPEYLVSVQIIDEAAHSNPTVERNVRFHEYCVVKVGDEIKVEMYSLDNKTWYLTEREARLDANR